VGIGKMKQGTPKLAWTLFAKWRRQSKHGRLVSHKGSGDGVPGPMGPKGCPMGPKGKGPKKGAQRKGTKGRDQIH